MLRSNRRVYLDFLRILACFLVIFNHLRGYSAYQQATSSLQAFYYMGYTMFTRINVPIFFMISGSLLLSKDIHYKDLILKRITRILAVLLCASFAVYLIMEVRKDIGSFDLIIFFRRLLKGEHASAYWYLYAYLGFLVSLPFLRRIAKQFSCADFIWFLAVHFIFSTLLPLGNYVLGQFGISGIAISSDFNAPLMVLKAFFYPLVGYYIDQVFDISRINRKNVWFLLGILLVGIAVSSAFTYHQGINGKYTQEFVQTFDYSSAIAVFLLVKHLFVNVQAIQKCSALNRAVTFVGPLTFGIYLMDPVLKVVGKYFNMAITTSDPILYSVLWCLFSMSIGGLVTFCLKKIPIVKNLL